MRAITILLTATLTLSTAAQQPKTAKPAFKSSFEQAYALYQSGHFVDAASRLEALAHQQPNSFDVHELLGLAYAASGQDTKALSHLLEATRLAPASVSARNNLATALIRADKPQEAETEWRSALATDPGDYTANHNLARLYLQEGKSVEAVPLLEAARKIRPDAADNGYELARALASTEKLDEAHRLTESLLQQNDDEKLHVLLGQIDEKQARYVDAVNEYSAAAHLDPSEENLFIWAAELMAHRAYVPAIQIFQEGTKRYPQSARLWVGQGMALYARGDYEPSIQALLKATDLNAEDPRAYLFLSKAYLSSPSQAEAVIERFRRYAALKPADALAQYDYAISLWKGRRANSPEIDYPTVQRLLLQSIALNGNIAEVHLQLGNLYNDQHQYEAAQAEFERAVQLDPSSADAHFRLGRSYLRAGSKERGEAELDRFKLLQAQHQAALDKDRAEVQQFVVATQGAVAGSPASQAAP